MGIYATSRLVLILIIGLLTLIISQKGECKRHMLQSVEIINASTPSLPSDHLSPPLPTPSSPVASPSRGSPISPASSIPPNAVHTPPAAVPSPLLPSPLAAPEPPLDVAPSQEPSLVATPLSPPSSPPTIAPSQAHSPVVAPSLSPPTTSPVIAPSQAPSPVAATPLFSPSSPPIDLAPSPVVAPSLSPPTTSPVVAPSQAPYPLLSPSSPPIDLAPPVVAPSLSPPTTSPVIAPSQAPSPLFTPSPASDLAPTPVVAPLLSPPTSPIFAPSQAPVVSLPPPIKSPSHPFPPPPSPPPSMLSSPPHSKPFTTTPTRPSPSISHPPPLRSSKTPKLQVGFYEGKCFNKIMDVEALIATKVEEHFRNDTSILPALLRLQFHDCFVHGCDASILIEGNSTERTAGPNLSVRGYEFIEALKVVLEQDCPGIVSCADIIVLATKVAIKLGGGPDYPVQTGRRDGLVSKADDVDLPSPTLTVSQTIAVFKAKNFTAEEMVVLLGCHAVGIAHCSFFQDRLYLDTNEFDSNMDPDLREQLKITCPHGTISNNFTLLNQNPMNSSQLDNSFYTQILEQRGILPIDQALARDPLTHATVLRLSLNATLFNVTLGNAMVKLQAVDVLTADQGEIRNVCSKFN